MPRADRALGIAVLAALAVAAAGQAGGARTPGPPGIEARRARFTDARVEGRRRELELAVEYFQELVEWALTLRAQTAAAAQALGERGSAARPVTGAELEALRLGTREHLAVRDAILEVVDMYRGWHEPRPDLVRMPEDQRAKGVLLGLAGGLVLYDNFELSVALFQKSPELRRVVNRADASFGVRADALLESLRLFYAPAQRQEARTALNWIEARPGLLARSRARDPQTAYLDRLVRASGSAGRIAEGNAVLDMASLARLLPEEALDGLDLLGRESTQLAIGQMMREDPEAVVKHQGRLVPTSKLVASLAGGLRPLDVLLDKSRWRLIDAVIPGYFTHLGIWLGGEAELRRLGVWDEPAVRSHRAAIVRGDRMLEAVRSGVRLSSLESFLNLDDLAVLRRTALPDEEARRALLRAFGQVGKEYDFNFDAQTTDRLVCSEVPYLVFTDIEWPTRAYAGRATVSPDNIAEMALPGGPFALQRLFVDGREVDSDPAARLRGLLASE